MTERADSRRKRVRSPGLAIVVGLVACAGVNVALHEGTEVRLRCDRTGPHATVCAVTTRKGVGTFAAEDRAEVTITDEMRVERSEGTSRRGKWEELRAVGPSGRDRLIVLARDGSLTGIAAQLQQHASDPSSSFLDTGMQSHLGALFLFVLAAVFFGVAVWLWIGYSIPEARQVTVPVPALLKGRSLVDAAAFVRANPGEASWVAEIEKRITPPEPGEPEADEETRVRARERERQRACRRYLRELFPDATPRALSEAWARAEKLDEATTRMAKRDLGYPGTAPDEPLDPRRECPGFGDDVYGYVYNRRMTDLR